MLLRTATLSALALVATQSVQAGAQPRFATNAQTATNAMNPQAWLIGPVINGVSYSRGMPLHPSPGPGQAWHIPLPRAPGSLNAVTFRHGSLAGKRQIVIRYRIEAAPGVRIERRTAPAGTGLITLYFQRRGDNWSARGRFEAYRWYATFASRELTSGEHQIVAPLNGNWTAVMVSSARTNPIGFADALANADQVGFVLGGGEGYGKGVYATGPARLVVTEFRVE
jgi:hypothetical protein